MEDFLGVKNKIDISYNVYTDTPLNKDPDSHSPTLRRYHKMLWSKPLPGGELFDLRDDKRGFYLFHSSTLGDFSLGSDAITHSYKNHTRKRWLTTQVPEEVQEVYDRGSTIGGYLIFPKNQVEGKNTINQARGRLRLIDDRFDLTLECIKRFYINEPSPLEETLKGYATFFRLFETFEGYVQFFLLNDLVDAQGKVKFYLPFNDFRSPPMFKVKEDYLIYANRVVAFINSRNRRIEEFASQLKT